MIRRVCFAALVLSLPLGLGCAPESLEEEEEGSEAAFTDADAGCFQTARRGSESVTEAHARCLTDQASRMLEERLDAKEDPRDAALAAFKGKIRVAAETGCFTEDVTRWMGVVRNDITSRRDVGTIAVQIKGAIEFLKYYYRDLDGYPNHFFDRVDICPSQQIGGDLGIQGSRLQIGMPTKLGWHFGVHTNVELRDAWSAGEHLRGNAALEELKGLRWAILDPVGTPRTTARKVIRTVVTKLKAKVKALDGKPEAELRAALTQAVKDESAEVASDDGRSIKEWALEKIAAMTADQLVDLVKRWDVELSRKDLSSGAEDGAVTMRDAGGQKNVSITVNQIGIGQFHNFKKIAVDLGVFLPGGAKFGRYVEVRTGDEKVELKVNQIGAFQGQLNDLVDVNVQILYQKTAGTAALHHALGSGTEAPKP